MTTSMTSRTCVRCHNKKIRCAGYPGCQSCRRTNVVCELYQRQRKRDSLEALRYYKERTQWLEGQLQQQFGIHCADLVNGAPLRIDSNVSPNIHEEVFEAVASRSEDPALPREHTEVHNASTEPALDASIVTLNATGDARYLGPSSGIFFALYANTYAQLSSSGDGGHRSEQHSTRQSGSGTSPADGVCAIDLNTASLLGRAFCKWVTPLYPIFTLDSVEPMVERCIALEAADPSGLSPKAISNLAIFYLVMSLGAVYEQGTAKPPATLLQGVTSASLHGRALQYINAGTHSYVPSVSSIQVLLLLSLYSMHGPVASTQWQLVGSAMRMAIELGLHSSSGYVALHDTKASEERRRVFWTAYVLEITLAYNLGRPPSIGEEHITVALPDQAMTDVISTLHIKHRQIQHRLISKVYGANQRLVDTEPQMQISALQQALYEWKNDLSNIGGDDSLTPYTYHYWLRLYHSTTFVLHRASPLCPNTSLESTKKCLRSAGAYVTDVTKVLKESDVPLSWMLVQGVLFAGLTMLVTARLNAGQFDAPENLILILVDLPAWTRQCSICLAIMNERWDESLLSKLTAQFEGTVNDTLHFLSSALARPQPTLEPWPSDRADSHQVMGQESDTQESYFELMRDVMGFDPDQSFWDLFPMT